MVSLFIGSEKDKSLFRVNSGSKKPGTLAGLDAFNLKS